MNLIITSSKVPDNLLTVNKLKKKKHKTISTSMHLSGKGGGFCYSTLSTNFHHNSFRLENLHPFAIGHSNVQQVFAPFTDTFTFPLQQVMCIIHTFQSITEHRLQTFTKRDEMGITVFDRSRAVPKSC